MLGIVAILAVASSAAFRSIGQGAGADGASTIASSLALGARVEAMKQGRGARLAIDATYDAENPHHYLRRLAIFRGVQEEGETEKRWELASKPVTLPQGVSFLPDYSDGYETMQADLQAIEPQTGSDGDDWYFYEFGGTGHLDASGDTKLIFGPAIIDGEDAITIPEAMATKRRGFLLRANGRAAFFENPDQMPLVQ